LSRIQIGRREQTAHETRGGPQRSTPEQSTLGMPGRSVAKRDGFRATDLCEQQVPQRSHSGPTASVHFAARAIVDSFRLWLASRSGRAPLISANAALRGGGGNGASRMAVVSQFVDPLPRGRSCLRSVCCLTLRCTRPATGGFTRFRRRVNSNV